MEKKYSASGDDRQADIFASKELIVASRRLQQNPYAHLDGDGSYRALLANPALVFSPESRNDALNEYRRSLQNPYALMNEHGKISLGFDGAATSDSALQEHRAVSEKPYLSFRRAVGRRHGDRYSNAEIEKKASDLQKQMWKDRKHIWSDNSIADPIEILDSAIAFEMIGFDYEVAETLGQYYSAGKQIEVAGIIDDARKQVKISRRFPLEVRNFTAAHELGHALLHDARGLHRDRALDGSATARNRQEYEADIFATCFLMPEKLVKSRFESLFLTQQFRLDEDTIFALGESYSVNIKETRDLSRKLAAAESYNGNRFRSMATQFGVSVEAMAIRIEELGLVVH